MQKAINFNDVVIVYVNESGYRIHFWYMSKNDAINIMNNPNLIDKIGDLFLFFLFCFVLFCFVLFFLLFLLLYIKMSNTAYYKKKTKTRY